MVQTKTQGKPTVLNFKGLLNMIYKIVATGKTSLIMHNNDVEWADLVKEWQLAPENAKKKGENSGDDRRPAFTWIGYLYHNKINIVMPFSNLTSCLIKAGARVPYGRNKTFKELAASAITPLAESFVLLNNKKPIPHPPIWSLIDTREFRIHAETATKLGFSLFVKRRFCGNLNARQGKAEV